MIRNKYKYYLFFFSLNSDLSGNNISTINFGDGYKSVKIM